MKFWGRIIQRNTFDSLVGSCLNLQPSVLKFFRMGDIGKSVPFLPFLHERDFRALAHTQLNLCPHLRIPTNRAGALRRTDRLKTYRNLYPQLTKRDSYCGLQLSHSSFRFTNLGWTVEVHAGRSDKFQRYLYGHRQNPGQFTSESPSNRFQPTTRGVNLRM